MLYGPDGSVALAPEWQDLARRITYGDGVNWAGDDRLWLGMGVISDQFGRERARRLEVWRACEDGQDRLVGTWNPAEAPFIPTQLAEMRAERPGGGDVLARIDAANEAKEQADLDAAVERHAEMTARLVSAADKEGLLGPRTTFRQVGGRRDDE